MEWPKETSLCCWYCTYPFDTAPVCIPNKYDEIRKVFYVTGVFCTWGCAKKYNSERDSVYKHISATLLCLLRHRVLGQAGGNDPLKYAINTAPHRNKLKKFGGAMTIEEFRDGLQALVLDERSGSVSFASGDTEAAVLGNESSVPSLWTSDNNVPGIKVTQRIESAEPVNDDEETATVQPTTSKRSSAKRDASIIESIVNAPSVKNQPYRLKRSKPVGEIGNTLFQSMNLKIEKAD